VCLETNLQLKAHRLFTLVSSPADLATKPKKQKFCKGQKFITNSKSLQKI